jgi:DNA-binding SARP family transcriptional activator
MRFLILGPLRLIGADGVGVSVARPAQRAVLTILLLHSNRPVPATDLAMMLAPSHMPDGSGFIRTHVWALRKHPVIAGRLRTAAAGYELTVLTGELDLLEFRNHSSLGREALGRANHVAAARSLGTALSMWREPYLADLPGTPAGQRLRSTILEERHRAFHDLADANLALERHHQVISDLRSHLVSQPADERAWGMLMIALRRSGRRADALETYLRARTALAESYGIDPGTRLRQIHQDVLADKPDQGWLPHRPTPADLQVHGSGRCLHLASAKAASSPLWETLGPILLGALGVAISGVAFYVDGATRALVIRLRPADQPEAQATLEQRLEELSKSMRRSAQPGRVRRSLGLFQLGFGYG